MEGSGDVNAGKTLPWSSDLFIGGGGRKRKRKDMQGREREKVLNALWVEPEA